ncbi:hypothetical protein B484DRAFT_251562, partial [Ochromonadaceae sp. CCMP2298]
VVDRAVSRLGDCFEYHVSLLVPEQEGDLVRLRVLEGAGGRAGGAVISLSGSNSGLGGWEGDSGADAVLQRRRERRPARSSHQGQGSVESCVRQGGVWESPEERLSGADLAGVPKAQLEAIFDAQVPGGQAQVQVLCVALPDAAGGVAGVLRLVYADSSAPATALAGGGGAAAGPPSAAEEEGRDAAAVRSRLLRPVLEMLASMGGALVQLAPMLETAVREQSHLRQLEKQQEKAAAEAPSTPARVPATPITAAIAEQERLKRERPASVRPASVGAAGPAALQLLQAQLARARRMHRTVCSEAALLMDAPAGGEHPATLSPLAASRDSCLKLLSLLRSLLRSEGQALLLRDPSTDPVTFQVIYTGSALHWAGIEQATFGVVAATQGRAPGAWAERGGLERTSLVESAMQSRRSLLAPDAPADPRYYAYVDGICDLGSPALLVPLRGRGGVVVGALVVARERGAACFSAEDVVIAEICAALGALSLYWCQGMGALHHRLGRSAARADHLQRVLAEQGQAQKVVAEQAQLEQAQVEEGK